MASPVRWIWLVGVGVAVSCGAPTTSPTPTPPISPTAPSTSPAPTGSSAGASPAQDTAARIARIEHGLVPEVRVRGESSGATIEERLRANHTPGVSIAIIHDHRVVAAKAYGVADAVTGARLTEATLMQAASISKMVTGFAALREVEAHKMSLDTNVNQTLRSWKVPDNEFTRATPVTLKHLLSHSANTTVPTLVQEERQPTLLDVLEGRPPAINKPVRVEAAPGSKFRYSGGGTTIVQQMLVDVEGGKPFPDLMNDVVFAPLKLTHSTFVPPSKLPTLTAATGHDFDGTVVSPNFQPWVGAGGGGLWTTPSDIAQLLVEVQLALRGQSTVVSRELASRFTTPVVQVTKDDSVSTSLGAFIEKHGKGVYFGHDGHGIGFLAIARASTTDGEGAVVMANGAAATPVMLEILRSVAAEFAWEGWLQPPIDLARLDAQHLASLSGRYGGEKTESTIIEVKGSFLEARQAFRDSLELLPVSKDVFVSRADGSRFTFSINDAGVRSLVRAPPPWPPGPPSVTLTRLPEIAPLEPLQLLEAGRVDDAIAAAKKALAANAKDPTLDEAKLRTIGEDLLEELDAKRALSVFQLNVALYPKSAIAHANVAEALFRTGRRADALPMFAKARTLLASDTTMNEYVRASCLWRLARLRTLESKMK